MDKQAAAWAWQFAIHSPFKAYPVLGHAGITAIPRDPHVGPGQPIQGCGPFPPSCLKLNGIQCLPQLVIIKFPDFSGWGPLEPIIRAGFIGEAGIQPPHLEPAWKHQRGDWPLQVCNLLPAWYSGARSRAQWGCHTKWWLLLADMWWHHLRVTPKCENHFHLHELQHPLGMLPA